MQSSKAASVKRLAVGRGGGGSAQQPSQRKTRSAAKAGGSRSTKKGKALVAGTASDPLVEEAYEPGRGISEEAGRMLDELGVGRFFQCFGVRAGPPGDDVARNVARDVARNLS